MFKVDNFTLCFDVIASDHSYQQMVGLDESIPMDKVLIDSIKKGNIEITSKEIVRILKDRLLSLLGNNYEVT